MAIGEDGNSGKDYRGEQIKINNDVQKQQIKDKGCC